MFRDTSQANSYKKRLGHAAGFAGDTEKKIRPITTPNRTNGFYYYGPKKKSSTFIYQVAKIFLLLPIVVLFLISRGDFIGSMLAALVGVIILLVYAVVLFRA